MAETSSVLEDDSWLSRLDRGLFGLECLLALAGGLAVLSLMGFAVVSVAGRNALNMPISGYVDWIEQVMPLVAFLGLAYCQRLGGHIRMDVVVSQLRGRTLWTVEAIGTAFMLLVTILLLWGSWAHFERAFDWLSPGWSRDSSVDIGLPLWPMKLIVPLAFALLAARLAVQLYGYTHAALSGTDRPIAVPRPIDAATQIQSELSHLPAEQSSNRAENG